MHLILSNIRFHFSRIPLADKFIILLFLHHNFLSYGWLVTLSGHHFDSFSDSMYVSVVNNGGERKVLTLN